MTMDLKSQCEQTKHGQKKKPGTKQKIEIE